jgi:hypothetical protein
MENRMLDKNLIFYTPGIKGTLFTLAAKTFVNPDLIKETKEYLEYETENLIQHIEERRAKPRDREM